ncbi:hypothetical protein Q8A73_008092 [Channa argus]|nr:hypothetical protein Q8A73_008092 [Channa argus]
MNLERLPNEEKLSLCRKYYLGGFAFLPFLWLVNVVWFFREAFIKPTYTEQLQIKTYVKRSAFGLLLWVAVLTTWITIFQHFRAEWGEDPEGQELRFRQTVAPLHPLFSLYHIHNLTQAEMDFILPPTLPAGDISWERVLSPLIPRLNGTYGQYKWSPKLLIPETENTSSAEKCYFGRWSVMTLALQFELMLNTSTQRT